MATDAKKGYSAHGVCMSCGGIVGDDGLAAEIADYHDTELSESSAEAEREASEPKSDGSGFARAVLARYRR